MDKQQQKTILKQTFDTVSGGYDGKALRFFLASAKNMAALLDLRGDEQVLDVACGTGHASLAVAPLVPKGRVTAVDFSPGMLDQARRKAASLGVTNIEFIERDMQALEFENRFDAAVCAFGIFFAEDMDAQLAHIAEAVKPGATIMVSTFQENYFQPLRELLMKRAEAYGVKVPAPTWKKTAHEEGCTQLFVKAGLTDVRVETGNVGYYLAGPDEWWDVVWNAGFRRMVGRLAQPDQQRFKEEHLKEVAALADEKGIWLDVGVLYTSGRTRDE